MTNLTNKVLVLGVDGMDPSLTKKYMDQGILPNITQFVQRGAKREDLTLLCTPPTITPPLWTTLATGALPVTHGITCFWNQDKAHLDTMVYSLDSRMCQAEQLWNVTAEAGKKTLVWHWPGSSWPPSSDCPLLHVVEGTQPGAVNAGTAKVEDEKVVVAKETIKELSHKAAASNDTGAGCIIEDLPEMAEGFNVGLLQGKQKVVRNLILTHEDGELALDKMPFDLDNSPIREAKGWSQAPSGAKECSYLTSKGLVRRPCLILPNAQGVYDTVAVYKSKTDKEPLVVLKAGEFVPGIVDEYYGEAGMITANRNMRLLEIEPDGSALKIWMSKALDMSKDGLFHPKTLYKEILENVGAVPPTGTVGGKNYVLVRDGLIPSWENYCQWQADAINHLIATEQYDVVFSHIHHVDQMGHAFWYFGKARAELGNNEEAYQGLIAQAYRQTDRYVGRFMHLLEEGWTIFIVSDHGLLITPEDESPLIGDAFGCNIRVMEELGFTVLKRDEQGNELREIDWEKTRAVATRGGQIYINLKGKYATGIVEPSDKYELEREIIDGLYSYRFNGKRVIAVAMRNKEAVLLGTGGEECGDVLYWLEEGFNRLHGDALPTLKGYADTTVSPIFIAAGAGLKVGFTCQRLIRQVDVAPTIAALLGVRMPQQCEGAVIHQILAQ